jgi:hypothetical protein
MTVADAVDTIVQYVRDTGAPLADAVSHVWGQISGLNDSDIESLVRESLASRAGVLLRNPFQSANRDFKTVSVRRNREMPSVREVSVQLLSDTVYHVNGKAKPIALFTKYDVLTKLSGVRKVEEGVIKHRQMWEYIASRLSALGKAKVEDLAEGEQIKIARMIYNLRQPKEVLELVQTQ